MNLTDIALSLAALGFFVIAYHVVRGAPERGVFLALIPALFFTEDVNQNYWAAPEDRLWTLHGMKLFGVFRPSEIIMMVLLLVLIMKYWDNWKLLRSPLSRVILLLLVFCPAFGLLSVLRGSDPVYALSYNAWRSFWWAGIFFFFCIYALKANRIEHYYRIFFAAICLRMLFGVVAFIFGYGESHLVYEDTAIVFWDGLDLHLASSLTLMSVTVLLASDKVLNRSWAWGGLVLSVFVILLSLRRGPVANVVFGFPLLFLILPVEHRSRILKAGLLLALGGMVVLFIAGGIGDAPPLDLALERAGQVFSPDVQEAHTFHVFDPIDHLMAILKDPILGIGFGTPIERTFLLGESEATFSHNAYLFVWGGMGIFGLWLYLALYYQTFRLGRRVYVDSGQSPVIAGIIGILITGLIQGIYSTGPFTTSRMPFILFFVSALLVKYQERFSQQKTLVRSPG